ncbi:MAG TPA: hypothetical protein VF669_14555 [Tepidisphaeraceae bacterium]|jgi:hypothetical protein
MLGLLKIPILCLIVAGVATALCRAMDWNIHTREMMLAVAVAGVAGELGLVLMLFVRHASQAVMAQAALVATMIHLFGCVIATAVIFLGKFPVTLAFSYWLMLMYFVSLGALVSELVRRLKAAPVAAASGPTEKH